MELHQLRYFLELSRELHFQKAAEKAHVTQPTLSQQIKKLEDELGLPLFERSPRNVRLTAAGKKFLPHVIEALERIEHGVSGLREEAGEISGLIRIAAIPTIAPYLLPGVISKIKKSAPKLVLEIYEETTSVLVEHLKEAKFEIGVLSLPIQDSGIVCRPLGKEPFYLAVSKDHPLAKRKTVSRSDIVKEKLLILQEGHCFSDQTLEFCNLSRKNEQIRFQGSSLSSVMRLVGAGEGITFVPKMAVEPHLYPELCFIPFGGHPPVREIGLAWRVTIPLTKAHNFVIDSFGKIKPD